MVSLIPHLLCLFLLQHLLFTSAQPYQNITLGSSLSNLDKNPYWTSPSGEFAFGFQPQQGGDLFLLAIWFAKIPSGTIIWTANEGNPVERGSKIELTSNGVLSLKLRNGTEIWKVEPLENSRVASAAMLNTGNFVLTSTESSNVWESFRHPTDTILPTQILELDTILSSRLTEEDYTIGRFEFSLQGDGNLVMYTIARPTDDRYGAYWASNTMNNGSQLIFNQSGYIYLTLKNGTFPMTSVLPDSTRDFYHRATFDFDGVFRQYTYPKVSSRDGRWPESWSVAWLLPRDICSSIFGASGSGVCGYNSYCKMNEDGRPKCSCPPGYIYLDPKNTFNGCKQNFTPQSCEKNELSRTDGFEMREIPNTDFTFSNYEQFQSVTENWCRDECLNDCFCAASVTSEGRCFLKTFPLQSGKMSPSFSGKALIKVGNSSRVNVDPPTCDGNKKDKNNWILPGSILLGSSVFLNLVLLLLISLLIYIASHKKQVITRSDFSSFGVNLRSFTYEELEKATDGFKEKLGMGAFSTVYKGMLESETESLVAVKRLDRLAEGIDKEFKAEVSAIGRTNHKNLVQLHGFCDEGSHRLLVYEFMRNGTLESFLFGSSRPGWYQRIQIAFGIARGLAYLHEECSIQIIHCDVKPQNILLDDYYVARISDFGLAKLLKSDQTRTMTGIRGTRGYVAPEWFKNMAITAKVDVYSFGIMLLEIVCCKKNVELEVGEEDIEILSDLAYECLVQRTLHLLVVNDEEAKCNRKNLERYVMVAFWCIQEEPSLRPSMKKVTQMLEGIVEVSMPPDPSSFMSSIN